MADEPMTVRRFFFGARKPEGQVGRSLGSGDRLGELRDGLRRELGKMQWKVVAKEIGKQIGQVLDFGIAERVLTPAWQRLELLQEYCDRDSHPPEETSLVPLYEHNVVSSHRPHIDLLVRDVEIGRLTLEVELALELAGVLLRIQDGRIWGVQAGSALGRGSLAVSYGERAIYSLDRKSRKFELATGLGFAKGIEIPALEL